MRGRFLILTAVLLGFLAQAQTFSYRKFSEENGLPQNFIYCISQGPDRYLYCSTGEGVAIFDGFNFKVISNKKLADNFVTTHFIDSRAVLWLGHNQNGLSYVRGGKISALSTPKLSGSKVTQILEDKKGNLMIATAGGGIFRVDTAFRISALAGSPEFVYAIAFDTDGCLLAATSEGIRFLLLSPKSDAVQKELPALYTDKKVRQIVPVSAYGNFFWALCEENDVLGIRKKKSGYTDFRDMSGSVSPDNFISCIYSDKDENLWLGTFGSGVKKLSFTGHPWSGSEFEISSLNGFSSQHVQSIYQDIEGNMWFGTLSDGLIQKPVEKFSFYGTAEGLLVGRINKMLATRERLWLGTDSGLALYFPDSKQIRVFNEKNRFVNDVVTGLVFDQRGRLWIGTANSGIFALDTASLEFEDLGKKFQIPAGTVNSLTGMDSNIVAATTDALYVIHPTTGNFEKLTTTEGLLHNNVLFALYDSKKRLWLASHGAPPYYISEGKVTAFKNVTGLNSFRINSFCEDQAGRIWIATEGDGVFVYENNRFRHYTKANGLLSEYCNGIICAPDKSVWVTHRGGLSEKRDDNQFFNPFTEQKGLIYTENTTNGAASSGTDLWFGTRNGLVNYQLNKFGSSEIKPEVAIRSILFNNRKYLPGENLDQSYGYYSVQFEYIAVLLGDPMAVVYKYRLLGVDSVWQSTTTRSVNFPKLGDGSYTVQIMACNRNDGLCGTQPVSVSFVIHQPVWKKAWFYFLLVLGVVAITYTIVIFRTRTLKRTQLLLQLKVKQKTFLLQREKEAVEVIKIELEHKNKDITDSINYAKRIQESILPPEGLLKQMFGEDYFVFFKPKDIVSGDFFWAAPLNTGNNGKLPLQLAAVIDCTGHGVPGAFLSIMANDFLKQSVAAPGVNNPSQILDFLNQNVSSHLNQSASTNKMRDGMDIALIGIDHGKSKLYFSGANNPIYIYRNVKGVIDQIILTATKQAIGLVSEETVKYAFREFNLLPGDIVYLFSDGYADQFGGENNKKFSYKRFRETLVTAFPMPMHEQKAWLEKTFDEWCGDAEQIDDVTVMGIRIR